MAVRFRTGWFPTVVAASYWLLLLLVWFESLQQATVLHQFVQFLLIVGLAPVAFWLAGLWRRTGIAEVEKLALTDGLTGLPNRSYFMDQVEKALARAARENRQVAAMFLDLDRFKVFNDTMGHSAGDKLITQVARRIHRQIRSGETFARLGGDEFTVLLEIGVTRQGAEAAAGRILRALEAPFVIDGHEVFAAASIGIAVSDTVALTADELIRRADVALYEAKAAGRARFRFFESSGESYTIERLELDAGLRTAIENGELHLYYQPVVSLEKGSISGFEALIRWQNPDRGLLLPGAFISEAEDMGLMSSIGKWVLREACHEAARWPYDKNLGDCPSVAINVSPGEFLERELVTEIRAVLTETGLAPHRLTLEIIETALLDNHESTVDRLEALSSLGIRIAIDDFGAGYSSLGYLRDFPVDIIKIDRAFITELANSKSDTAIVSSIVSLAHGLGKTVIAEGVEDTAQLRSLMRAGCDSAQGFLFARPMPAEALTPFLTARAVA